MSLLAQVRTSLAAIIERRRAAFADESQSFSVAAVYRESIELLGELIVLVQSTGGDNAAKRAAVLEAVGQWYDAVIEPLDIPYVPDVIADPILRAAVLKLAGMTVDGLVGVLKSRNLLGSVAA